MLAPSTLDAVTIDTLPETAPPPAVPPLAVQVEPQPRWTLGTRIAFRLCFLYFSLYVLTTQMLGGLLSFSSAGLGEKALLGSGVITWVGTHVFHISYQYSFQNAGSGDKTFDYLQSFALLAASILVTAVWSFL